MPGFRIIISLFAFLLLFNRSDAQTIDEIVQKHIAAIGGYEKIKAIKTITFEGSNQSNTINTTFKSYIVNDRAACTIGIANGKKSKGIVTKKDGWICTPDSSIKMTKKTKLQIKLDQRALDIQGPLIDYEKKGNKIKYLGLEKINNVECYKLKLKKSDKSSFIYYIDNRSYLITRTISLWPIGNVPEFTYDYTYKTFENGYTFAIRSVRIQDSLINTYNNYIINPTIDKSVFAPCK